jgi:hypothetical protein
MLGQRRHVLLPNDLGKSLVELLNCPSGNKEFNVVDAFYFPHIGVSFLPSSGFPYDSSQGRVPLKKCHLKCREFLLIGSEDKGEHFERLNTRPEK